MKLRALMLLAVAVLSAGCAGQASQDNAPSPQPSVGLLIASRGVTMPLLQAVRTVRFAPFLPSAQIAAVAVIPPLSDDERKRAPGIAFEYESRGNALLLSEWPREGLDIAVGGIDATSRPCAPVAYKADGLLWTTRNGRVMTLQPDGVVTTARLTREAARLLHAGACGSARTPSRPPRARRSPSASLPRQSAS